MLIVIRMLMRIFHMATFICPLKLALY